jgi:hypothetical protein
MNTQVTLTLPKELYEHAERWAAITQQDLLKPTQGRRLSTLLEKRREGALTEGERLELLALMQVYNQLWIRQSEALAEAVRRGLRKPLEP